MRSKDGDGSTGEADDRSQKKKVHHQSPIPPGVDFQKELYGETYCPPLADPLPLKPHEHPLQRSLNILGVTGRNDPKRNTNMMFPKFADIVIIGG